MVKSNAESQTITEDRRRRTFFTSSHLLLVVTAITLLLGGMLEMLAPSIISNMVQMLAVSISSNVLPVSYTARLLASLLPEIVIGALLMAIIIILRQDELVATVVIAVHLYIDWYLALEAVALIMVLTLLLIFFLARSSRYPWGEPRALWLWGLFLALAIFPVIYGEHAALYDIFYYPNLIFGALIFFWLGTVVARDIASVRRFFKILSVFGTLLALHSIILATTGIFLFRSSHYDTFLALIASNFSIDQASGIYRVGAFFVDPNWNGTFFAVMLCIPLGLFVESTSVIEKVFYLAETFIILPALLFTYSAGAWIAALIGVVVFVALIRHVGYGVLISSFIVISAIVSFGWFPAQANLLFQHATTPGELSLRIGAWETALRVIQAFPLTGIGIGLQTYLDRADPYRVLAQFVPLEHPHNSYLELGAMAGLPVLIAFVALIVFALQLALRNRVLADARACYLLSGGIAAIVALTINSWSINGWTLPPLAAIGWLILGVISSPLLMKSQTHQVTREKITKHP